MAEPGSGWEELHGRALALAPRVIATTLRPKPAEAIEGRDSRVLLDGTRVGARGLRAHLRDECGADVVHVSGSLADRAKLRTELASVEAEVFLVELKAAAIDVVAEAASERGVDVVLAGSDVSTVDGEDLDAELLRLAEEAADVSERRKGERNFLGSRETPYSKGLMARALTAVGVREEDAYELARRTELDLAERGEVSVDLDRLSELAGEVAGRGPGHPRRPPAAPLPRSPGARPAADHPRRRRHGHRQVDRRDRGRLPARDHARHLDRLRAPDDAGLLRQGVHALDPLLELRGRSRADEGGGGGVGRRGPARLPRPDAQRPDRRRSGPAAGARRGLVDGARGRPPRAGDDHDRARRARSSSTACSGSATRRSTGRTSGSAT